MGHADRDVGRADRGGREAPRGANRLSKTPEERLQAVELMRRIVYGDAALERIKRAFEVTRRGLD